MRRIRWTLLLVALGLGIPVGVLAWRALEGLALERAVRHQALAERVFDEMERSLSVWLAHEEARPFDQYRFYVEGDQRSPLAYPPADPFVIGAFQIDPDGSVHTPMQPRDTAAAKARGHWPPPPEVERAIAQVVRIAREQWRGEPSAPGASAGRHADRAGGLRQDPGTTRALAGPLAGKGALAKAAPDRAKSASTSVYDLLERLNTGAEARSARRQKVETAQVLRSDRAVAPSRVAPSPARPEAASEREEALAPSAPGAPRGAAVAQEPRAPERRGALGYALGDEAAPDLVEPPARAEAGANEAAAKSASVRVTLDPMVGRATGDGHLLLYRTVLVGEQGYRQGLVIDRAALGRWLTARALGPSGLAPFASVRFDTGGAKDAADTGDAFVFQHRFAEPFDALSARLSLPALPGVGQPRAIYALVALLAVVGLAGLLAIHRMVGLTVHFAERRNNFVSAVTHELKTPLTSIRMYAEMLRDGLVADEKKRERYYGTITDESERLSRLIDNVLEFSRLERGAREMSFHVGPVADVVREAAEKLRAHAANEGFALDVEIEPDLPPVRYDRDALLQVLFNLVDNAMKYARGAATRRVVLEARSRQGGVEIAVRDFGPGVPGRHLSRIFEPFYRGEHELTRSARGTGIGLALVRDLASRMDAAVRGANVEDGGFRVCLVFRPAGTP